MMSFALVALSGRSTAFCVSRNLESRLESDRSPLIGVSVISW